MRDRSRNAFHASPRRRYACCEGKESEERRGRRSRVVRRRFWSAAQQGADLLGGEVLHGQPAGRNVGYKGPRRRQGLGQEALEAKGHWPRANREPSQPIVEGRRQRTRTSAARLVLLD